MKRTRGLIHAVDQMADDYQTCCGMQLGCDTPILSTPFDSRATCLECIEERQARAVELSMMCDHPPWQDSWFLKATMSCPKCGTVVLAA